MSLALGLVFARPLWGDQDLIRPEPHHLASLILGIPTNTPGTGTLGVMGAFFLAGENGLQVWNFGPLPGLTTPLLAASMAGAGFERAGNGLVPFLSATGLLDLGHQMGIYQVVDPKKVLPLPDFLLDQVRDREPIGEGDFGAYLLAVTQAGRREFSAFWEAGKANQDLTRGDLMNRPAQVRGKVVRGEGVVRRIRKLEPLAEAVQQGVGELYECWIFQDLYGANPICVVTTRLGPGLVPGEDISRKVRFAGYFLKPYRYAAAQTVQGRPVARESPLIIGPELLGIPEPRQENQSMGNWPQELIGIILGVFAVALALVWGMTWWMRSGDNQVRKRLKDLKGKGLGHPSGEGWVPREDTPPLKDWP